jgi:uncharacterized protein
MRVLVDADSCPRQVRAILVKAARNRGVSTVFTADRNLPDCRGDYVAMNIVEPGLDSADSWIINHAVPGDLCVTRDMLLAAKLVELGCTVLDDRGGRFTAENMAERLSIRNVMTDFREAGIFSERNRPITARDVQLFANALDRELTAKLRSPSNAEPAS